MSMMNVTYVGRAITDATSSTIKLRNGTETQVTRFKVVYKPYRGEQETESVFISVSCWGARAEFAAKWVKKGTSLAVTGPITKLRVATDRKDGGVIRDSTGVAVIDTEMQADHIELMGNLPDNQTVPAGEAEASVPVVEVPTAELVEEPF